MPDTNSRSRLRHPGWLGIAAIAALALGGCGGGGSSGSSGSTSGSSAAMKTGSVAVLITDAPIDAFCEIRATITGIDLLGPSGPTNLYTGSRTVNVLAMQNFTDFFTIDPSVPIGSYDKIRLTLSDLALVECVNGEPEPESGWEHPHLPGNGKLDLNPRGTIEVIGGETLMIRLDMDMEKSLHLHQTGNGKWQFRPVIFVDVRPGDSNLVRVFGQARNVGAASFELCPVEPVSTLGTHATVAGTECLDVFTDGQTGIFDATGSPIGLAALAADDPVTAIGFLTLHDDADADTRMDDLRLDAVVLEYGPQGTFARLPGSVVSAPGNNDVFVFDPSDVAPIDVLLQAGTRIFAIGSHTELTSAALQPGATGEVNGVFTDPAVSGEPLKSSLVVLDQDTTPDVSVLDATVASLDSGGNNAEPNRFDVTVSASTQCVKTDATTVYLQVTESSNASETAEIAFANLAVGDKVDVYGKTDPVDSTCVLAGTVQKYVTGP
ncbi:MAG TPA: DUF4382 domain-containing protein [Steroidobacteraceae bacterium]